MAYIPINAKWYVAELVEEITVEGESANVVHKNLVLIRADSADEAYEKAQARGREAEDSYANPAGQQVCVRFRGITELNVVHDELEDGAELLYEEHVGVDSAEIQKWIPTKHQLAIFRQTERRKSPDYSAAEIVEDAERLLADDEM